MAKQPYIPFYIGDYIRDTRILPLNVRGGWVELILQSWDSGGEIVGTMEDFSRLMSCTKEEAILVIQVLKQKNIFGWEDLPNGEIKIICRKIKKMQELSEKRKKAGLEGGNPDLVKQNKKRGKAKVKQNTENENEYEYENENEKEKGVILPFETENFKKWWDLWKNFRSENSWKPYKKIGEQSALAGLQMLSQNKEDGAVKIIQQSMSNGWKGFFELKNIYEKNTNSRAEQVATELSELSAELKARHSKQ